MGAYMKDERKRRIKNKVKLTQSDNLYLQLINCTAKARKFIDACVTLSKGNYWSFFPLYDVDIARAGSVSRATVISWRKDFLIMQREHGKGLIDITEGANIGGKYSVSQYRMPILLQFDAFEEALSLTPKYQYYLPNSITEKNRLDLWAIAAPIVEESPPIHYLPRKGTHLPKLLKEHPSCKVRRSVTRGIQKLLSYTEHSFEDRVKIEDEFVEFLIKNGL